MHTYVAAYSCMHGHALAHACMCTRAQACTSTRTHARTHARTATQAGSTKELEWMSQATAVCTYRWRCGVRECAKWWERAVHVCTCGFVHVCACLHECVRAWLCVRACVRGHMCACAPDRLKALGTWPAGRRRFVVLQSCRTAGYLPENMLLTER